MFTYLSYSKPQNGDLEIEIDIEDAKKGYHSGSCDADIEELQKKEYIKEQLNPIPLETLCSILDEYGCEHYDWEGKEEIESIVLWIACGNIVDDYYEEEKKNK